MLKGRVTAWASVAAVLILASGVAALSISPSVAAHRDHGAIRESPSVPALRTTVDGIRPDSWSPRTSIAGPVPTTTPSPVVVPSAWPEQFIAKVGLAQDIAPTADGVYWLTNDYNADPEPIHHNSIQI